MYIAFVVFTCYNVLTTVVHSKFLCHHHEKRLHIKTILYKQT